MNPRLHERIRTINLREIQERMDVDEKSAVFHFSAEPTAIEAIDSGAVDRAAWQVGEDEDLHNRRVNRVPRMNRLGR